MLRLKPVQLGASEVVAVASAEHLLQVPRPAQKPVSCQHSWSSLCPPLPRYEQLTGTASSTTTAATGILPEMAEALTAQTRQAHEIPVSWVCVLEAPG